MSKKFIVSRKMDNLGRIVLPQEARNILGIDVGMALLVAVSGNQIILEKKEPVMCYLQHNRGRI